MTTADTAPPDLPSTEKETAPEHKKHRRAGGRERRDPKAKINGPAYIKRNIPTYDVMGEEKPSDLFESERAARSDPSGRRGERARAASREPKGACAVLDLVLMND